MALDRNNTVLIEGANLPPSMRNFAGEEKPGLNAKGLRNFCVVLDKELAQVMKRDGWNVKQFNRKPDDDPNDEPDYFIQVHVRFDKYPPEIFQLTSRGRIRIDERFVSSLDWGTFTNVDIIFGPHNYDINGNQGVKAYLRKMFVTIEEDYLDEKYSHVPEVQQSEEG